MGNARVRWGSGQAHAPPYCEGLAGIVPAAIRCRSVKRKISLPCSPGQRGQHHEHVRVMRGRGGGPGWPALPRITRTNPAPVPGGLVDLVGVI